MIVTALAVVGFVVLFGGIYLYGRYMDHRLGIKNDQDYYDLIARGVIEGPKLRKSRLDGHFRYIFESYFSRFRHTFHPIFQPAFPGKSPKVIHLDLLDDSSELPADVLPSFERDADLIRWLATHTMISQSQVQKWFKGNTANLAYLVKGEREKYARKH